MADYNEILDSEIDPESPITESLMTRLRDNPIAMIEGAAGAPRATSRIVSPGGSAYDGPLVNATDLSATGPGFLEFSTFTLTASKAFPWVSRIRVDGDLSITGATMSASRRPASGTISVVNQTSLLAVLRALSGSNGDTVAGANPSGGGGGGACGAGGASNGGAAGGLPAIAGAAFTAMNRGWVSRIPIVGGSGAKGGGAYESNGLGGGSIILLVNGDIVFDTAVLDVSGGDGFNTSGNFGGGGGGGGSVIVICNGNIHIATSLSILANGGAGFDDGSEEGGGGGGGLAGMIAASFTGVAPTVNVAGGAGAGSGGVAGSAGLHFGQVTLSEAAINSLMLGAVE